MEYFIKNLDLFILLFFSLFCIGFGIILLTKKKIMCSNIILQVLILSILLAIPIKNICSGNFEIFEVILYIILLTFVVMITKKCDVSRYTIMNMKYDTYVNEFIKEWNDDLENKISRGICIKDRDLERDLKRISTNSIEIDLRAYKNDNLLYYEIKNVARKVPYKHDTRYLSYDSIILLVLGLLCLLYTLNELKFI